MLFFINFIMTLVKKRDETTDRNPWQATTIEWSSAPSPPIAHGNFDKGVTVYRGAYEYSVPGAVQDFTPQNERR